MAEQPALNRFYVASYAANDRDFPIVAVRLDPRVAGYRVPEDLSPHPDSKRYPNHVFTGSQPSNGDERVTHIYEILPSPWVPFTRYDDDLGPIQGRRRSVKNEGQVASLAADKRVTYEAREGSAIVYTEIEESWSIETDDDGNSLFPIRDRDFYDASRGPVQERRQLFVPTGEEAGSLENVNGVITQTSYEPYNEFLSVKIVQTYSVDGPQLIGKATDEARQLATVTTQRKAAEGYIPPSPTATKTVEVSREDAESLVERVVEVPEVFGAESYRKTREDITPQKFKAAQEDTVFEQTVEGTADPNIVLGAGEFVKSEEQINKFTKRVATTSRSITSAVELSEKVLTPQGQIGTRLLKLDVGDQSFDDTLLQAGRIVDASVEALGDNRTVLSQTSVPSVFAGKTIQKTRTDLTPEKFKAKQEDTTTEETVAGVIDPAITLGVGQFRKSEEQVTEFVKRVSTTTRDTTTTQTLSESLVTAQGQVATRTLSLTAVDPDNPPVLTPDELTVDASIEALGDDRVIISNTRVGEVFEGKTLSLEKPDVTPQKFRAQIPSTIKEITVAGAVGDPVVLTGDEISKSEQQVTNFVKRVRTEERNPASTASLTGGRVYTSELGGGIAEVVEDYSDSGDITVNINTVSASSENLGDDKFVSTKVSLPVIPTLVGQEYDEVLDAPVPYTQTVVATLSAVPVDPEVGVDLVPRNNLQTVKRTVDKTKAKSILSGIHHVFGSTANVNLPDKLISVKVIESYSFANAWVQSGLKIATGVRVTFKGYGTVAVTGDLVYEIEQGYSGPVQADRHVFFMDQSQATLTNVLNKINQKYLALNPSDTKQAQAWPMIRPKSHTIVISGGTAELSGGILVNGQGQDNDATTNILNNDYGGTVNTSTNGIPPTLHGDITITKSAVTVVDLKSTEIGDTTFKGAVDALYDAVKVRVSSDSITITNENTPSETIKLKKTTPEKFAYGRYLTQIDTEPYRYGMVRVSAVVVDIPETYT